MLSDAGNAVAKQYGLVFTAAEAVIDTTRKLGISLDEYNRAGAQTLPAAATFIVGPDGRSASRRLWRLPLARRAGAGPRRSAPEA